MKMNTKVRNTFLILFCAIAFAAVVDDADASVKMAPWYLRVRFTSPMHAFEENRWNMVYQLPTSTTCHVYAQNQWRLFYQTYPDAETRGEFSTLCVASDHGKEYFHTIVCERNGGCMMKGGIKG